MLVLYLLFLPERLWRSLEDLHSFLKTVARSTFSIKSTLYSDIRKCFFFPSKLFMFTLYFFALIVICDIVRLSHTIRPDHIKEEMIKTTDNRDLIELEWYYNSMRSNLCQILLPNSNWICGLGSSKILLGMVDRIMVPRSLRQNMFTFALTYDLVFSPILRNLRTIV